MGLVAGLLRARARCAGVRWALVAAAIALATVPLVVGPGVAVTTAAAALRGGVAALPAGERSLTVSFSGIAGADLLPRLDGAARAALTDLGSGQVRRQVLFNALADRTGATFRLAGSDDLPAVTRLVAGRWPASCRPGRCEVVLLDAAGEQGRSGTGPASVPDPDPDPDLGLVPVGRVVRTDPLLLGGTFDPGDAGPVLLAGPGLVAAVPEALSGFGRAYGWVSGWDADRVAVLGVDGWLDRATRQGTELARVASGVVLTVPAEVLRREAARAELSARRLGLLAAGSCVVLLGAAAVGGSALRRDHEEFTGALRARGAGAGLVAVLLLGEAALATVTGVLAGLPAGGGVVGALAARAGLPAAATAVDAVRVALPAAGALAVAAALLLVATVAVPAPAPGRGGGIFRALEAGAAACLGASALLVAGGGVDAEAVRAGDDRGGLVLTLLPVLLLTAAALSVARVWPALARAALRLSPRRALGLRLGLAAVAGRPGRPAATAAVLATAVAAAVFAAGYAATLDRGVAEQAAHAVPLDARLLPGAGLAPPLDAVPPDRLAAALPGASAAGVVRAAGSFRIGPQQADVIQLVGLDPAVLPRVAHWSAVTGQSSPAGGGSGPAGVARLLKAGPLPTTRGLPPGRTLRIETSGDPLRVALAAVVRAPDGRERTVPMAAGPALTGTLPALADARGAPAPLDLVALTVRQPTDEADRRLHALGEGSTDQAAPAGRVELGTLSVDGRAVTSPWRGWSATTAGVRLTPARDGARAAVEYRLAAGAEVMVPPATPGPVPVAVDATTASSGRAGGAGLTLLLDGVPFDAVPVSVLAGFPTVQGRFAVMDARLLADLVGRTSPGRATPGEVWLDAGPAGPAALAGAAGRSPLDRLDVRLRARTEATLRADPVASAATGLLLAGAAVGLVVALAAVALVVVAERSDDAAVHYAWEADGVPPGTLRAGLWWGAVAVVVPGTIAGALAGVGLSLLAARLVSVTATATAALPPLRARPGDPWVLAAVAASVLATLAVAAAVAARSHRQRMPVRPRGRGR